MENNKLTSLQSKRDVVKNSWNIWLFLMVLAYDVLFQQLKAAPHMHVQDNYPIK